MVSQSQIFLRRLILIGTPFLTGILLLFHPRPVPADPVEFDVIALLAPVVDMFLAVHVLFAPMLALLGLAVHLLLNGIRGIPAIISRVSAFVFVVAYIMYETIVGSVAALLVRGAAALPPGEQTMISNAIHRIHRDPLLGDSPSALFLVASLSWPLAVIMAAFALRSVGKPLVPCILLGLSSIFTFHASPLGTFGMILFLLAFMGIERSGSPVEVRAEYRTEPFSQS